VRLLCVRRARSPVCGSLRCLVLGWLWFVVRGDGKGRGGRPKVVRMKGKGNEGREGGEGENALKVGCSAGNTVVSDIVVVRLFLGFGFGCGEQCGNK